MTASALSAVPTAPGVEYQVGDLIYIGGGAGTLPAALQVNSVTVVSATVATPGTGGTSGAQTVTGTTGSGTKFIALVNVAGGSITGVLMIISGGQYYAAPANLNSEPVTGGNLVGAALSIAVGAASASIYTSGAYVAVPPNPVSQFATSGIGSGATWNVHWSGVTPELMRLRFSELGDQVAYPDSVFNHYIQEATARMNPGVWADNLDNGVGLYTAHYSVLKARAMRGARAGGIPGDVRGPTGSKSVGSASISFDTGSVTIPGAGLWNATVYGIQFYQLLRIVGMGGMQLLGSPNPSPYLGNVVPFPAGNLPVPSPVPEPSGAGLAFDYTSDSDVLAWFGYL